MKESDSIKRFPSIIYCSCLAIACEVVKLYRLTPRHVTWPTLQRHLALHRELQLQPSRINSSLVCLPAPGNASRQGKWLPAQRCSRLLSSLWAPHHKSKQLGSLEHHVPSRLATHLPRGAED